MKLDLTDMLYSLSFALDQVEIELLGLDTGHGKRVACLSLLMAKEAGFEEEELRDFIGCCILHDNALTEFIHEELAKNPDAEFFASAQESFGSQFLNSFRKDAMAANCRHSILGEQNIRLLPFHTDVENIILYHHENADGTGFLGKTAAETGLKSQILHLADMVDMTTHLSTMTEAEFEKSAAWVQRQSGRLFSEAAVTLFQKAVTYQTILSMQTAGELNYLQRGLQTQVLDYSDREIHHIADLFAKIVDYKSSFTQAHSLGVAARAEQMARYYGFSPEKTIRFYFAGAMHDIGKLIIPNDILEKPGKLTSDEFTAMKDHAAATYFVLHRIKGISDIVEWASNHHEKLDGSGYPKGLRSESISFEDHLLACIDIYQALTEKRPYKNGLSHEKAIAVMEDMVRKGELDGTIVQDFAAVFSPKATE